jgi:hypothetical protein
MRAVSPSSAPAQAASSLGAVAAALAAGGFLPRGGFLPEPGDAVPPLPDGRAPAAVVLVGSVGPALWARVRASPEWGGPDPLDRYTRRTVGELAPLLGCEAVFPFGGPPWHPFQRWALRAEPGLGPSPLGILAHPVYGLWHAYRAALLFASTPRGSPEPAGASAPPPCATCAGRPCLASCPAGALGRDGYDVPRCRAYLRANPDAACLRAGCLARHACPIGREWAHTPDQAVHHMRPFADG